MACGRAAGWSRTPPGGGGVGRIGAGVRGATGGGVPGAARLPPRPRSGSRTVAEVSAEVGGLSTMVGDGWVSAARAAMTISRPL